MNTHINDWDLSSTNLRRLQDRTIDVAVLPIGATEAHNLHLPEGQDTRQADYVARRCCQAAHEQGARVICLPPLPYGVDHALYSFPLTIHVQQATLDAMVRDIAISLVHHDIHKLVIINSHGGNDFVPLMRDLQHELDIHTFLCNWWTVASDKYSGIFEKPDDHAGELETSVALALYPELVEHDKAKDGSVRPFRFEALRKGWLRTPRNFARLNDHAAVGDPSHATADKGRRVLDIVCERVTTFLVELSATEIDEHFPHTP
jgi:creatinine amidohydrolase